MQTIGHGTGLHFATLHLRVSFLRQLGALAITCCADHVQHVRPWPQDCHPDLLRQCSSCKRACWDKSSSVKCIVFSKDAMLHITLHDYKCSTPGCCGTLPVDGSELAFIRKARWASPAFAATTGAFLTIFCQQLMRYESLQHCCVVCMRPCEMLNAESLDFVLLTRHDCFFSARQSGRTHRYNRPVQELATLASTGPSCMTALPSWVETRDRGETCGARLCGTSKRTRSCHQQPQQLCTAFTSTFKSLPWTWCSCRALTRWPRCAASALKRSKASTAISSWMALLSAARCRTWC